MQQPVWMISMLQRCVNSLRAEEMLQLAIASRLAGAKQRDFERALHRLEIVAAPLSDEVTTAVIPATEEARRWFIENGIRVVEA